MSATSRLKELRWHLRRGRKKVARIVGFNRRRRRAIKRLEAELETRAMFDSVTISEIPKSAGAVAGYTGGSWPTYWDLVKEFPHAFVLDIAVASSYDARCLDIESGDATVAEAIPWLRRQHARGVKRPRLYIAVSGASQLLALLDDAGYRQGRDYLLWTAHWTFEPHLCGPHSCGALQSTTADATQWTDQALGRNLDQSLVSPEFIG